MISYNTLIVLMGASLLGTSAGMVGTFAVLRGRALVGDALAHAALPGICLAFLLLGEKSMPAMLLGALLSGLVGVGIIAALRRWTRVKEDAAIGIVLSVLFGAGIVLSRLIQNRSSVGSKAGLDSYILGKTAGMLASDVMLIAAVGALSLIVIGLFYKEFKAVVFDPEFAKAQGWPVLLIDVTLMALVALSVVIGLPAVGVVLMAALLILPGAAARFWTNQLSVMLLMSGVFGLLTALFGSAVSAYYERLPAGPIIVLVGSALFLISLALAPRRGIVARIIRQVSFRRQLADRLFLQRVFNLLETDNNLAHPFTLEQLSAQTTLATANLRGTAGRLKSQGLLVDLGTDRYRLTDSGAQRAANSTRGLRLWQVFLTEYPDLAPSMANLAEESVEGLLPDEIVRELTEKLRVEGRLPRSADAEAGLAKVGAANG
jgi:manganese/zinc/iron transport system permease protein